MVNCDICKKNATWRINIVALPDGQRNTYACDDHKDKIRGRLEVLYRDEEKRTGYRGQYRPVAIQFQR